MGLKESVFSVAKEWENSPYYRDADSAEWLAPFWGDGPFLKGFSALDLRSTIELACGRGRHAERVAPRCGHLHIMDVLESNIAHCRERLSRFRNVSYHVCSGHDFRPIGNTTVTAIYCYDSMVHFSPDVVRAYINDTARVLKNKGRALFHHSNFPGPSAETYMGNPAARNVMTRQLFANLAKAAGLTVIEATLLDWPVGGHRNLDCLTLLEKP
jgi:SAM-dependent methyltransferase